MEKGLKEAIITGIYFEPRYYVRHRNRGTSSDYYKNRTYYCYRAGFYSEYRPARLCISLNIDGCEKDFDISNIIRERCGGALKKGLVDSLYATLPEAVYLTDFDDISEESINAWISEANAFRNNKIAL